MCVHSSRFDGAFVIFMYVLLMKTAFTKQNGINSFVVSATTEGLQHQIRCDSENIRNKPWSRSALNRLVRQANDGLNILVCTERRIRNVDHLSLTSKT